MTCSTCLLTSGYSHYYFQENVPSVNVLFIAFDLFFFLTQGYPGSFTAEVYLS